MCIWWLRCIHIHPVVHTLPNKHQDIVIFYSHCCVEREAKPFKCSSSLLYKFTRRCFFFGHFDFGHPCKCCMRTLLCYVQVTEYLSRPSAFWGQFQKITSVQWGHWRNTTQWIPRTLFSGAGGMIRPRCWCEASSLSCSPGNHWTVCIQMFQLSWTAAVWSVRKQLTQCLTRQQAAYSQYSSMFK